MSLYSKLKSSHPFCGLGILFISGFYFPVCAGLGEGLELKAAGWAQYGAIVKSSDTLVGKEINGRTSIVSGAQFALIANPSKNLRIESGLGAAAGHALATSTNQGGYAPVDVGPYVSNANFKYTVWDEKEKNLSIHGGYFHYDYTSDAQNLGLYLLRGPVYPGYVLSGFETKAVLPVANTLGFQIHHQTGNLEQDLLLTFETEFYPYWDASPAYISSYRFGSVFRIGAGVNLYHYLPVDSKLTANKEKYFVDTTGGVKDTSVVSFKGTKVMANASFDIKALFGGLNSFGAEDLKLYAEVAIIGLDNGKAYKTLYGNYSNRMPIMVGFNIPTFKILDRLSLEVEKYDAKFKDDISRFNHYSDPSPIPRGKLDTNYAADNIKWSVYASRTIQNHVKLSLQVASDHYRPGVFKGYGDNNTPSNEAVFYRPDEWYWTSKIAYFF